MSDGPHPPTAFERRPILLRVLGPVEVIGHGEPIPVPAGHRRNLLAWLIMHLNRSCSLEGLIEVVWHRPNTTPARPRRELRPLLLDLQERLTGLGRWIRVELGDDAAALRAPADALDANLFTELVTSASTDAGREEADDRAAGLDVALALWRGDPYPEIADLPDAVPEITRLLHLRLDAIEAQNGLAFGGRVDYFLVARLRALVTEHPERERLWCQLAQAEYCNGRRADALRTLSNWRRERFLSGQRLPPSAAVLEQAILDHDPRLNDREVGRP